MCEIDYPMLLELDMEYAVFRHWLYNLSRQCNTSQVITGCLIIFLECRH